MSSTHHISDDRLIQLLTQSQGSLACQHARDAYPRECCGMILASGLRRCRNLAESRPADSGSSGPSPACSTFELSAEDCLYLAESMAGRDPVLALYHSHPDGTAKFSAADLRGAMFLGRVAYPGLRHLVIACDSRAIGGARLFRIAGGSVIEIASFAGDELSLPGGSVLQEGCRRERVSRR